jgi:hypothetical protein
VKPELHYLPEMYVRMWHTDFAGFEEYPPTPEEKERLSKRLQNHLLFAKKLVEAKGKLLVGTDNYYHVMAGLGVWHEMEILADAGIPPLAVLQAATIHPAIFSGQDKRLGTVETGKLADLLILSRNPLENISNIRSLETVIQHGKVQDREFHADFREPIPRPYMPVNSAWKRPYITSVSPAAVPLGTKNLVLTIKGRDFHPENRVLWNDLDLRATEVTPTEMKVRIPDDYLSQAGTHKIHLITGGRVHAESLNYMEIMVTFGRRYDERWNGWTRSTEW